MTYENFTRLSKLNVLCKSLDKIIDVGLQRLQQSTTDDLKDFRAKLNEEREKILTENEK